VKAQHTSQETKIQCLEQELKETREELYTLREGSCVELAATQQELRALKDNVRAFVAKIDRAE